MIKTNAKIFCYISVVLTEHLLDNLRMLYSFKVMYVTNFIIINAKMNLLCKNIISPHGKLNFY